MIIFKFVDYLFVGLFIGLGLNSKHHFVGMAILVTILYVLQFLFGTTVNEICKVYSYNDQK